LSLQTLPALASVASTRGAGLFLLSILTDIPVAADINKNRPGVRCAAARAVFLLIIAATGRGCNCKEQKERPGR